MAKLKFSAVFLAIVMALSMCGAIPAFAEDGCVQKKIDNSAIRLEMTGAAFTDFEAGGTKTFHFTVPTTGEYSMWFDNAKSTTSNLTAVVKNGENEVFNKSYTTKANGVGTNGHERFGNQTALRMSLTAGVDYTLTMTSDNAFTGMKYIDFRCLNLPVQAAAGAKTAVQPSDFYSYNGIAQHVNQQYYAGNGFISGASLAGDYAHPQDALRTPLFTNNSLEGKYHGIVLNNNVTATYKVTASAAGWYDVDVYAAASPGNKPLDLRLKVNGAKTGTRRYTGPGDQTLSFPAVWLNEGENVLDFFEFTSALYLKGLIFTSLGTGYSDTPTAIAPTGETDVELKDAHAVSGVSNYAAGFKAKAGHYSEQDITFSETGYYNFYTYMKAHQASFNIKVGEVGADGNVASYTDVTNDTYRDIKNANLNNASRVWEADGYLRLLMYNSRLFEAGKTYRLRIEFLEIDPSAYTVNSGFVIDKDYEAFVCAPITVKRADGILSDSDNTYISAWDVLPDSSFGYATWSPVEQAYQGYPQDYDCVLCIGAAGKSINENSTKLRNVLFLKGGDNTYRYSLKAETAGFYSIGIFADSNSTNSVTFTCQIDNGTADTKTVTDDGGTKTTAFNILSSVYLSKGDHTITLTPVSATGGTWRMYGLAVTPVAVDETYIALDEAKSQCDYNVKLTDTDGSVIVALYSGKELVGVDKKDVTSAQTKVNGTVKYSGSKPEYAKIFVWKDLVTVTPLISSVKIENSNWY